MMKTDDMESESWYQDMLLQQQQQAQEEGSTYENFQNEETAAPFVEENARPRHHAKKHRRAKKTHRSSAKRRTDDEVRAPKGGSGAGKLLDSESWFGEEPSTNDLRRMTGSLVFRGSSEACVEQDKVSGATYNVGSTRYEKSKKSNKNKVTTQRRTHEDLHLAVPSGSRERFPGESSWRSEESAASDPPGLVLSSDTRKHISTYDYNEVVGGDHVEGSESILTGGSRRKRSKKRTSKTARSGRNTADKSSSLSRQEKSRKDIIHPDSGRGGISVPYFALETEATSSTFVNATLDGPSYGIVTQEPSLQIGAFRVGGDDVETHDSPVVINELEPPRDSFEDEYATIEAYRVEEEQPLQTVQAKPFRDRRVLVSIATFGVLCVIIGLTIFLTTGNETPASPASSQDGDPRGALQARLTNNDLEDEFSWTEARRFYNAENNETISTGFRVSFVCKVIACLEGGDEACKVTTDGEYEPGCCIGKYCTEEEKCVERCPLGACRNTVPFCSSLSCMECDKADDGTDLYTMVPFSYDINCLDTGYAMTTSGEVYKWAIICGPVSSTGQDELNYGFGEYACGAFRQGESIREYVSMIVPCQYLQLAECGCAPNDVFDFGLGPPAKPCKTREDCFILCSDAGEEHAKELCYSFGGIEWWEGANAFNHTFFVTHDEGFEDTVIDIFDESPPS